MNARSPGSLGTAPLGGGGKVGRGYWIGDIPVTPPFLPNSAWRHWDLLGHSLSFVCCEENLQTCVWLWVV